MLSSCSSWSRSRAGESIALISFAVGDRSRKNGKSGMVINPHFSVGISLSCDLVKDEVLAEFVFVIAPNGNIDIRRMRFRYEAREKRLTRELTVQPMITMT
jgi:hypothetical protein